MTIRLNETIVAFTIQCTVYSFFYVYYNWCWSLLFRNSFLLSYFGNLTAFLIRQNWPSPSWWCIVVPYVHAQHKTYNARGLGRFRNSEFGQTATVTVERRPSKRCVKTPILLLFAVTPVAFEIGVRGQAYLLLRRLTITQTTQWDLHVFFCCAGRCAKQITRIHFASTRSRTTSSNSSIAVGRHCFPIPFCLNPKKQPQKRVNFDFDKIKKLKEKKK